MHALMRELKKRIEILAFYKDKKTPFYEKLPKDSPFYKHFISVMYANRMQELATDKVNEERNFLQAAATFVRSK